MKLLRLLFLLIALGLVASIVHYLGPAKILAHFQRVGWRILFVFLIGFPRYFLYTLAWGIFLPKKSYPFWRLFQIKVAGELITRSTPIHFLGGDTARVLLMGRTIPRSVQTSSVVMDRTVMTLAAAVVVLLGLLIGTVRLPLPVLFKIILWWLVVLMFWGLLFIISHQKKTALVSLLNLFGKIGFRRWILPPWKTKLAEVDEVIRGYYEEGHAKLVKAVAIMVVARLTVALEIYLLILFLGIPLGPLEAVILSSLSLLLTVVFFLFPGNLGILEGTYGLLFHWLGLDPATGVSLELLRKLNAGLWYFVGGVIALTFKREKAPITP